jgi:hypothetical protein
MKIKISTVLVLFVIFFSFGIAISAAQPFSIPVSNLSGSTSESQVSPGVKLSGASPTIPSETPSVQPLPPNETTVGVPPSNIPQLVSISNPLTKKQSLKDPTFTITVAGSQSPSTLCDGPATCIINVPHSQHVSLYYFNGGSNPIWTGSLSPGPHPLPFTVTNGWGALVATGTVDYITNVIWIYGIPAPQINVQNPVTVSGASYQISYNVNTACKVQFIAYGPNGGFYSGVPTPVGTGTHTVTITNDPNFNGKRVVVGFAWNSCGIDGDLKKYQHS